MCRILIFAFVFSTGLAASADVVQNVWAQQRPNTKLVDVYYDLVAPEGGCFKVSLVIKANEEELPLITLSGDVGMDVVPGRNKHVVWNAGKDWPEHVESNCVAVVAAKMPAQRMKMVWIPPGVNEGEDPDFGRYALTNAAGFWMDQTEVTYNYWKEVYDWAVNNGYEFQGVAIGADFEGWAVIATGYNLDDNGRCITSTQIISGDSYVVYYDHVTWPANIAAALQKIINSVGGVKVSWYGPRDLHSMEVYAQVNIKNKPAMKIPEQDVVRWCNARSEMEGRQPIYHAKNGEVIRRISVNLKDLLKVDGNGYRLPTVVEWQYAARGGRVGSRYPWGNDFGIGNEIEGDVRGLGSRITWQNRSNNGWYPCELSVAWCEKCPKRLYDGGGYGTYVQGDVKFDKIPIPYNYCMWEVDGFGSEIGRDRLIQGNRIWTSYAVTASCGAAPVASFPPNGYQLYDIVGNVPEFVEREVWNGQYLNSRSFWLAGGQSAELCRCGNLIGELEKPYFHAGLRCIRAR